MTEIEKGKILPVVAAGLLALLFVLLFAFPGEEAATLQPLPEQQEEERKAPLLGRQEVKGLERAEAAQELRDPFTLRHEQAAEAPKVGRPQGKTETAAAKPGQPAPARPVAPAAPARAETGKSAPAGGINLQGIAGSAEKRLALLSDGQRTAALAVGESLGPWQVRVVEENRVLVAGPGGERWLQLALP